MIRKSTNDLDKRFDQAMFGIYRRAKEEAGYSATLFLGMLSDRGGLLTAKSLINAAKPSSGYTALYEPNRLDLTVEALVVEDPTWWPLFAEDEMAKAKRRLTQYQYVPKMVGPHK